MAGESRRRGIELTAKARIGEAFDLGGSFTYLRAEDGDGEIEVRRPKFIAGASDNYRFLDGRANVNLSADYNGRMQDLEFINRTPRTPLRPYDLVLEIGRTA